MGASCKSDVERLEVTAWRVFFDLKLGPEIAQSRGLDDVLRYVIGKDFGSAKLTSLALVIDGESYFNPSELREWVGGANTNLQRLQHMAAYAVFSWLRMNFGRGYAREKHGSLISYHFPEYGVLSDGRDLYFLGTIPRNLDEQPLVPGKDYRRPLEIDLRGRKDGSIVLINGEHLLPIIFDSAASADSHGREAFRRLKGFV